MQDQAVLNRNSTQHASVCVSLHLMILEWGPRGATPDPIHWIEFMNHSIMVQTWSRLITAFAHRGPHAADSSSIDEVRNDRNEAITGRCQNI